MDRTDNTPSAETSGNKKTSRVVAIRVPERERTELWHTVHVVGPENGPGFAQMLARAKCTKSKTGIIGADFVIFTGGFVDVHPSMYGADPNLVHDSVYGLDGSSAAQMMEYIEVWQECFYLGIPMIGVCLGAQFLHVMNGGKLYQDVDNHNSGHPLYCNRTGKTIKESSSVHHQACIYQDSMNVIAESCEANERWIDGTHCELVIDKPDAADIEGFWYEQTMCLGVQGHPEYQGYPEYTEWFLQQILHYIVCNDKLAYENNTLRMKEEALKRRNFTLPNSVHEFIKEYQ